VRRKLVGLKNPVHGCCQVIQCVQQRSVQIENDRFEITLGFSVQRDFFKSWADYRIHSAITIPSFWKLCNDFKRCNTPCLDVFQEIGQFFKEIFTHHQMKPKGRRTFRNRHLLFPFPKKLQRELFAA